MKTFTIKYFMLSENIKKLPLFEVNVEHDYKQNMHKYWKMFY